MGTKTKDENVGNNEKKKQVVWNEVEHHGHAIATIFCGSVMSYITGGLFHSAKTSWHAQAGSKYT